MSQTEVRVLTKVNTQHYESLLVIDWTGITQEEIQILAQWAIIHNTQAKISKGIVTADERILINAGEMVKESAPPLLFKYTPPPPKPVKLDSAVAKAMANLSDEERAELISLLGG